VSASSPSPTAGPARARAAPRIALLHWGDLIEDFLDTIGVSFEAFRDDMTGGWMFGYVEALQRVGVETVLICVSSRSQRPERFTHAPTGAPLWVLPPPRIYRALRRRVGDPLARRGETAAHEHRRLRRAVFWILRGIAPYLATPLGVLARALRRERCAAIVCQEYEYARFDTCVLLGQLMRRPVFATFQGGDRPFSCLETPLRRLALRGCTGLIVGPATERDRIRARYGVAPGKIARIFNPLDVRAWRETDRIEARAALGLPGEAGVVVSHGRIDLHRKGIDVLLDAWSRVCAERPRRDLRLVLLGTGPDAETLRARLSTGSPGGVVWIDRYVHDRGFVERVLSAADVYALASRHEGFPVAPLEAMSCARPVVAADAPGVPDIFERGEESGGLVVPRGDPVALAHALGRVLDDPALARELGRRARRRAETHFALEVVGSHLKDFIFEGKVPGS
jgi:glycosyltransferase involved in cell wall biosynthesis